MKHFFWFIPVFLLILGCEQLRTNDAKSGKHFALSFEERASSSQEEILQRMEADITHTDSSIHLIKGNLLSAKPATAVIVGSGTVGIEGILYAMQSLPPGSTIIVLQHSLFNPQKLISLLKEKIPEASYYHFIISQKMDLGSWDAISVFLKKNKSALKNTLLYIHAADRAARLVPDSLPPEQVVQQIVRRASAATISEALDRLNQTTDPILKILVSSECAQNRDQHRIPNLGPYQMGKIVGDELFRETNEGGNAMSVIAYSGPMCTTGQILARKEEFELQKKMERPLDVQDADAYALTFRNNPDIDPMESTGMMFRKIIEAFVANQLKRGEVYRIYGPSVHPSLKTEAGVLTRIEPAPYLWPPLEGSL